MRRFIAAAGIALCAAGCADNPDPFGLDAQYTIDVPGNELVTPGCAVFDYSSCFAILDQQFKLLYETNSMAARRGEAEYQTVTRANRRLAWVFLAETRSAAEALRSLDRFIGDVAIAREAGRYSECWGDYVLRHARWLRGKIEAGSVDMSDAPVMACFVSPVRVTARGDTAAGVVLTVDDPWHFSGDPYAVYSTRTHLVVSGPNGLITTDVLLQDGAAVLVVIDPLTRAVGTYEYSVTQCADWGRCSEPVLVSVKVTAETLPVCVHDNRDQLAQPGAPRCKDQ